MKRIIAAMVLSACIIYALLKCESCTETISDVATDFIELDRDITVLNALTGDTLFSYLGPCILVANKPGTDVSLLYYQDKKSKTAHFIGHHIIFIANER